MTEQQFIKIQTIALCLVPLLLVLVIPFTLHIAARQQSYINQINKLIIHIQQLNPDYTQKYGPQQKTTINRQSDSLIKESKALINESSR